jgi:hypothetical protein
MKTPEPSNENPSVLTGVYFTTTSLTPRERRVLLALLKLDTWISRESIDRIAGASNGPQVIKSLREKIAGHDGLEMVQFHALDRDGRHCRPGYYRLTAVGRARAEMFLGVSNGL